jgi:hypothetical protein
VRQPPRRSAVPATMPSLAEMQQEPTILTGRPLPVTADMLRAIGQLLVATYPRHDARPDPERPWLRRANTEQACHKERTGTVLGWAS